MDIVGWDGWFHEKNGYSEGLMEKWVYACMKSGKVMRWGGFDSGHE